MRSPATLPDRLPALLDARRILRWLYIGRLTVAAAIYLAAVLVWQRLETELTLVASLAFAAAMLFTAGSVAWSDLRRRPLRPGFRYLQALFDLLLVTATVHVTGGGDSQFTALYILVIATAALLLPLGGCLLIAALANVLYVADVIWLHGAPTGTGVWLQLLVFAVVGVGTGYLSARLRDASAGSVALAEELRKTRLEAADILRNIRSGIITVDSAGRLLYANPAASAILGVELDAHLGRPVLGALGDISTELAATVGRAAMDGIRTSRAEAVAASGGRSFPIGVTTTAIAGDDVRPATATAIFSDISDQKRLEELHLRTERLEAVAELAASLAHEIRNPLASIRSAVEQLARMPKTSDDERTLSSLIVREADRLSRLLGEFLDFARVRVTRVAPVDIAQIAQGVRDLAESHPDRPADVTIALHAPERPVVVEGDEDLVFRILFNLVLNAVQASPAGAEVRIDVGVVPPAELPVDLAFEHGAIAIAVADEGPGIPIEIRDRLFDPFFTTKPGGSGLGLAVVHRAVEAHRGHVLVDSTAGGTRFTVLLPQAHAPSLAPIVIPTGSLP